MSLKSLLTLMSRMIPLEATEARAVLEQILFLSADSCSATSSTKAPPSTKPENLRFSIASDDDEEDVPAPPCDGTLKDWRVAQVQEWLHELDMNEALLQSFAENSVNGSQLLELSDDELKDELGMITLQVERMRKALAELGVGYAKKEAAGVHGSASSGVKAAETCSTRYNLSEAFVQPVAPTVTYELGGHVARIRGAVIMLIPIKAYQVHRPYFFVEGTPPELPSDCNFVRASLCVRAYPEGCDFEDGIVLDFPVCLGADQVLRSTASGQVEVLENARIQDGRARVRVIHFCEIYAASSVGFIAYTLSCEAWLSPARRRVKMLIGHPRNCPGCAAPPLWLYHHRDSILKDEGYCPSPDGSISISAYQEGQAINVSVGEAEDQNLKYDCLSWDFPKITGALRVTTEPPVVTIKPEDPRPPEHIRFKDTPRSFAGQEHEDVSPSLVSVQHNTRVMLSGAQGRPLVAAFRVKCDASKFWHMSERFSKWDNLTGLLKESLRDEPLGRRYRVLELEADLPRILELKETVYLPVTLNGAEVLVQNGDDKWLVDNSRLLANTRGLAHRRSKRLNDELGSVAAWGTTVDGIDAGHGWVQTQLQANLEKYNEAFVEGYADVAEVGANTTAADAQLLQDLEACISKLFPSESRSNKAIGHLKIEEWIVEESLEPSSGQQLSYWQRLHREPSFAPHEGAKAWRSQSSPSSLSSPAIARLAVSEGSTAAREAAPQAVAEPEPSEAYPKRCLPNQHGEPVPWISEAELESMPSQCRDGVQQAISATKPPIRSWGVAQVQEWLREIEMSEAVQRSFAGNSVNGIQLVELSDDELKEELGMTRLQVKRMRKVLAELGVCST